MVTGGARFQSDACECTYSAKTTTIAYNLGHEGQQVRGYKPGQQHLHRRQATGQRPLLSSTSSSSLVAHLLFLFSAAAAAGGSTSYSVEREGADL